MQDLMTSTRFLLLWVMSGIAACLSTLFFAVSISCGLLVMVAIAASILQRDVGNNTMLLLLVADLALIGSISGFIVGNLQKGILQQKSRESFDGWLIVSTIGGAVGAVVTFFILSSQIAPFLIEQRIPTPDQITVYMMELMVIPAGVMGVAQAMVLVRYVKGAWAWVLANMVGGVVFVTLLLSGWFMASGSPIIGLVILLGISATPAIVSGFAMLWLLQFSRHVPHS